MQAGPGSAGGEEHPRAKPPPKRQPWAGHRSSPGAGSSESPPGGSEVGSCPAMPQPLALTFVASLEKLLVINLS